MRVPPWFSNETKLLRAAIAAVLLLATMILGRHLRVGFAEVDRDVARAAEQGLVMRVGGGDVALRDLPRAHEILAGRFFGDAYYAGETNWYPFAMPLMVAAASRVAHQDLPEAAFRVEVVMTGLYLAAAALLAFFLVGWPALIAVPASIWLGWLEPGNGLYPGQAVRGVFCLFLLLAGHVHRRGWGDGRGAVLWPLGVGLMVGGLGLWNGAAFVTACGVVACLGAGRGYRALRERRFAGAWKPLLLVAAGAAVPLLLLFGPQLAQYHTLHTPDAARAWMSEVYRGGSIADFFRLALLPRGWPLVLAAVFVLRLLLGRRLGLAPWPAAVPLAVAFVIAVLLGHAGFLLVGARGTLLAWVVRAVLLAPPHTFEMVADACLPVVMVAGLHAIGELVARVLRQRPWWARTAALARPAAWAVRLGAIAACGVLLFTLPSPAKRYAGNESRAFDAFAKAVGGAVGDRPVFFRYPGRFVQSAAIKILVISVDEYANHYVQAERRRAASALDAALASGDVAAADQILDRFAIAYVMQDPRAARDAVVERCSGETVFESFGYVLRRRAPCRP